MDVHARRVKAWLSECLDNHASCSKKPRFSSIWCSDNSHQVIDLDATTSMPKRLVAFDIDSQFGNRNKLVKIVETTSDVPYFALSHRWGVKETCRATKDNLSELMEKGMEEDHLPPTFRDAVRFTREMRVGYLWIDSLCIIQDDPDDWREEARRMVCVYGNAICTITAVDARGSECELLPLSTGDETSSNTTSDYLESRAWGLQERMIPPRSLLFQNGTVQWECREADAAADDGPLKIRGDASLGHPKSLFVFFRDWRIPGSDIPEDQNFVMFDDLDWPRGERDDYLPFMKVWWRFLGEYTTKSLTHESDKFLALCGIANTTLRWIHMRHFWGIWSVFVFEDLAWCVDRNGPAATRPQSWLAPYYSWASTSGGRIINRFYDRTRGILQVKPQVGIPYGTGFDTPLPHPSWTAVSSIGFMMKAPMRMGSVKTVLDRKGEAEYSIELDSCGSFSTGEELQFWPDCPLVDFPVGSTTDVTAIHLWHYLKEDTDSERYIDVYLVLQKMEQTSIERPPRRFDPEPIANSHEDDGQGQPGEVDEDSSFQNVNVLTGRARGIGKVTYEYSVGGNKTSLQLDWNEGDAKEDEAEDVFASRTFRRIGYLEATYDVRRPEEEIQEEHWLRALRLL